MKTSLTLLKLLIYDNHKMGNHLHEHKSVKVLQTIQDSLDKVGALIGLSLGLP